jgi:phage gp29-like protein
MPENITLLDHLGRPIERQTLLREVAAPQLTGVRRAWDAEAIAIGLTPHRLARILRAATEGDLRAFLILAEEMEERDPHYASVLGTRKRACSGLEPVVEAATDDDRDQELADAVRERIAESTEFPDLCSDLLDGLGKGFAACEIIWDRQATLWRPDAYEWRDPKFFQFDQETGQELRLMDLGAVDGVALPPYKFIIHKPKLKSGLPARGGLARLACAAHMCKSFTVTDWMAFAEVFGMPLRLGRYSQNATPEDVRILVSAVANLGTDAAAVIPDGMRIELLEAGKSSGSGGQSLFQNLAEWLDRQVSKAVLGQTMTSDDGSSQSQATVHNEVRKDILKADARQLAATINRDLVRPFIDLNFGPPPSGKYPRLVLPVREAEDVKALTDALAKLVPLGLRVEASVVRDRLGFPDPADGAEVLGQPMQQGQDGTATNRVRRAVNRTGAESGGIDASGVDELDQLAAEALDEWEPLVVPLVDPIQELADKSGTYEEFMAGLPGLLEKMDPSALVRGLAVAAFKARGQGNGGSDG